MVQEIYIDKLEDVFELFSEQEYDIDMEYNGMVLVETPSIDHRIINQYSCFSVTPMDINNIEDFLINIETTP